MSIARLTRTFAFSLLAALLASGVAAANCSDPNRNPETHKLKFKVKDDGCVEKVKKDRDDTDATVISVCKKDTVEWKVTGNAKMIAFVAKSPTDPVRTPFDWAASGFEGNNSKIEGKVKEGAAGTYNYAVYVQGKTCVLDPTIIVDP
jgi:hypothetical protein